jgi:hypothetical protein
VVSFLATRAKEAEKYSTTKYMAENLNGLLWICLLNELDEVVQS